MKLAVLQALSFVILLVSADNNPKPCMPTKHINGHKNFLAKHVIKGSPETLDSEVWASFLRNHSFCHRPTQSFLPYHAMRQINDICSAAGGKILDRNLCISKATFSFLTVRMASGPCNITHVVKETKHIILACEEIEKICQPVHFQGNPEALEPKTTAPDCDLHLPASSIRPYAMDYMTPSLLLLRFLLL